MLETILVTGGAGFIGSNLVDFLCDESRVIVVDDLSTGKLNNLVDVSEKIELIEAKIENVDLEKLAHVDGVVHLAAQPSVPISIMQFKASSSSNVNGTLNVLDFCSKNGVPLVYASSSAIYGNLPLGNDKAKAIDLLSPYAGDKYAMEVYAEIAHQLYALSSVGLRFFNVYGPRQDPGSVYSGVISIFVDRLLKNQSITINGGYQTRDFIYVKDVVKCIVMALKLANDHSVCKTLNVLTGSSVTIDELADTVAYQLGVEPEKVYQELPIGDPEVSQGTIEKLVEALAVDPGSFSDINTGLRETIRFISEYKLGE